MSDDFEVKHFPFTGDSEVFAKYQKALYFLAFESLREYIRGSIKDGEYEECLAGHLLRLAGNDALNVVSEIEEWYYSEFKEGVK